MKNYPEFSAQLSVIGRRLRLLRHLKEEKIFTVAKANGISTTQLSYIENGNYEGLNLHTLYKLSSYYGVNLDKLIADEYEQPHNFIPGLSHNPATQPNK